MRSFNRSWKQRQVLSAYRSPRSWLLTAKFSAAWDIQLLVGLAKQEQCSGRFRERQASQDEH
jgi:hypothetical protein